MKHESLSDMCVRDSNGTIDVNATLVSVAEKLQILVEKEASGMATIGGAVNAVFDAYPGVTLAMPVVCGYAFTNMGLDPSEWVETCKAIALYVRTSPQFKVARGKGGGVTRL